MVALSEIPANAMGEAGEVGKNLSSECLDEVAQTVRGMLGVFRNWRTSGDRKMDHIFANRSGFRARLLVLKNEEVIEEHSNWELEETPGLNWCNLGAGCG